MAKSKYRNGLASINGFTTEEYLSSLESDMKSMMHNKRKYSFRIEFELIRVVQNEH